MHERMQQYILGTQDTHTHWHCTHLPRHPQRHVRECGLHVLVLVPPHTCKQRLNHKPNRPQSSHHQSIVLETIPAPASVRPCPLSRGRCSWVVLQQLVLHVIQRHADALPQHDVDVLEWNAPQVLLLQALQQLEAGVGADVLQLQFGQVEVEGICRGGGDVSVLLLRSNVIYWHTPCIF